MARRHFTTGRATFKCATCGRQTRITNQPDGSDLCADCDELAMDENSVLDGCANEATIRNREAILAEIAKKGGDTEQVKREFKTLFAFTA